MGICGSKKLSEPMKLKVIEVFRKIDIDGSKSIDKAETQKFWKGTFAKVNTDALFRAVDLDKNGDISEDEWLRFWVTVRKAGHTEEEIEEELDNLIQGKAWVQFDKVSTDVKPKID